MIVSGLLKVGQHVVIIPIQATASIDGEVRSWDEHGIALLCGEQLQYVPWTAVKVLKFG